MHGVVCHALTDAGTLTPNQHVYRIYSLGLYLAWSTRHQKVENGGKHHLNNVRVRVVFKETLAVFNNYTYSVDWILHNIQVLMLQILSEELQKRGPGTVPASHHNHRHYWAYSFSDYVGWIKESGEKSVLNIKNSGHWYRTEVSVDMCFQSQACWLSHLSLYPLLSSNS